VLKQLTGTVRERTRRPETPRTPGVRTNARRVGHPVLDPEPVLDDPEPSLTSSDDDIPF
jgi:hypothetical protein